MIFEANEYPPCFSREAWDYHEDHSQLVSELRALRVHDVSTILHVTAWPGLFNRLASDQENDNA